MTSARKFAAALDVAANGRRRVDARDIWDAFTRLRPDDARAADARQRLADLLERAADCGLLTPSSSTDRIAPVPLPTFVTLARRDQPAPAPPPTPWLPELMWAHNLRLTPVQHDVLERVNRWLRDGGAEQPVVPAEERSIELFNDEKAIAKHIGGTATLWRTGRLGSEVLRYENVPIPFPYRQVGRGHRLLMVENTAAFRTCTRLLSSTGGHPYYAVAFGQGGWAPKTIPSALDLPQPLEAVDYWGDLDVNGLVITRDVIAASVAAGLTAQAHSTLWRLMLDCDPVHHAKPPVTFDTTILDVLPADVRDRFREILNAGQRIPQERVGFQRLSKTPRWWEMETPI